MATAAKDPFARCVGAVGAVVGAHDQGVRGTGFVVGALELAGRADGLVLLTTHRALPAPEDAAAALVRFGSAIFSLAPERLFAASDALGFTACALGPLRGGAGGVEALRVSVGCVLAPGAPVLAVAPGGPATAGAVVRVAAASLTYRLPGAAPPPGSPVLGSDFSVVGMHVAAYPQQGQAVSAAQVAAAVLAVPPPPLVPALAAPILQPLQPSRRRRLEEDASLGSAKRRVLSQVWGGGSAAAVPPAAPASAWGGGGGAAAMEEDEPAPRKKGFGGAGAAAARPAEQENVWPALQPSMKRRPFASELELEGAHRAQRRRL